MSDQNASGSGQQQHAPRVIANTAKKPETVTRRGTAKMKFVPTLPVRRKKEEPAPETKSELPTSSSRGRGASRGRGRGRGRGDAGPQDMVASGPFALGPAMSGSSGARRGAPRSNFAPVVPFSGTASSSSLGAGLTKTTAPSLKREDDNHKVLDVDAYSDPDDGVEIIDIDDVRRMDWMAPESLRKEKTKGKKTASVKREGHAKGKGEIKAEPQEERLEIAEDEQVDLANAIDLSESEEEEELEDLINDFAMEEEDLDMDANTRQEKLFFFQFPDPFPTFLSQESSSSKNDPDPDLSNVNTFGRSEKGKKAVSFADGVKPPAGEPLKGEEADTATEGQKRDLPLDGVIGNLEIHKSGMVKMRLGNGILLDVVAATQPSFLQHAVYVDKEKKRLNVLGEVNRRFVVSPNVEALLESLQIVDNQTMMDVDKLDEGLIRMEDI